MEDIVPVTGRVLRYWYGALTTRCRHQIGGLLGGNGPREPATETQPNPASWAGAEVWSQPQPGHERTVVLAGKGTKPVAKTRVRMSPLVLAQPASRRSGTIISTTFRCTRSRMRRARSGSETGFV